ncbi:MAPEG family protein [Bdellovibrio sp. HCB288]|uniref:MAPEG family protein n=1 Tax=Bdellovibrio sp. HCB288 TaxID=3394355 RepID=UPI0039B4C1B2
MSLNIQIVFPMCAMFLLTVCVLLKVLIGRYSAVRSGTTRLSFFKTFQGQEPEESVQAVRHFANLFEAPVLFYVACLLGMILPVQGFPFVVCAWMYVIARTLHAFIHLGKNDVLKRMRAYVLGWLMLIAMWILIVIKATIILTPSR